MQRAIFFASVSFFKRNADLILSQKKVNPKELNENFTPNPAKGKHKIFSGTRGRINATFLEILHRIFMGGNF
ncbi:MAG: hypothetical protein J5809_04005 [Selenomonadaceae bacterium]|nr:hypothetical protein [Selenomonadaceae bacterium]